MRCAGCQRHWSSYLDGQLSAEARAQVERHLEGCGRCRGELHALQSLLEQLRTLDPPTAPDLVPGIRQRLARPGAWQRFWGYFLQPWPVSLPLHGAALATAALLVIIVVRRVGQPGPMALLESPAQQEVPPSLSSTPAPPAPRAEPYPRITEAFQRAAESSVDVVLGGGSLLAQHERSLPPDSSHALPASAGAPAPAETADVPVPLRMRWRIGNADEALERLQSWLASRGGVLSPGRSAHHRLIRLPGAAMAALLEQFPLELIDEAARPQPLPAAQGSILIELELLPFSDPR